MEHGKSITDSCAVIMKLRQEKSRFQRTPKLTGVRANPNCSRLRRQVTFVPVSKLSPPSHRPRSHDFQSGPKLVFSLALRHRIQNGTGDRLQGRTGVTALF